MPPTDGPAPTPDTARERRLARLRGELADENVPLPEDQATRRALTIEIDYAMRPPVHERRTPTYGAIVMPKAHANWAALGARPSFVDVDRVEPNFARRFADGRSTLLIVHESGPSALACFTRDIEREDDLVQLQRETGSVIVQRAANGRVRVFEADGIVVWDTVRWMSKPFAWCYEDAILRVAPDADPDILHDILDFAMHYVSASQVGTTIVWFLDDSHVDFMYLWDLRGFLTRKPPRLTLAHRPHFPALMSAIAQVDGALLMMPDGRVTRIGVQLASSDRAKALVSTFRGTRHTSAKRFSFDNDQTLVFVVSEDGPVSVFSDGALVASVGAAVSARAADVALEEFVARDPELEVEERLEPCSRCGKCLAIHLLHGGSADTPQSVRCPVCDQPMTVSAVRAQVAGVRKLPLPSDADATRPHARLL